MKTSPSGTLFASYKAKAARANSVPIGNHTFDTKEHTMPVNMQNIQDLANITSLDQLTLGADNTLQQRSGISAFFAG